MPYFQAAFRFRYIKNLWKTIVDYAGQIKSLFSTFNMIDLVDILFVAIMIYIVIRILRETRAMQLIKGLIFVAVLYFLVSFLGMSASSYILRAVFSDILIIVVILFEPEIRNILEQMGVGAARNTFKDILSSGSAVEISEISKTVDATCKACVDMSDSLVGALIVFENETMLGDIIETGTVLNAKPSKELIENIFYPKSPMHDGAMIIREKQIVAAGCILPLTKSSDISSALGTRHRAAIGLSEQCDAVVIVVSEETGAISVARNGQLKHGVSSGELRDILTNAFVPSSSSQKDSFFGKLVRRVKK